MEGRMTVCNMSHRVGRQGRHDRARPDHLRLHRGPPEAPKGADWDAAVAHWKTPASPTTTRSSTRRSSSTPPTMTPFVTWGTNPGQGVPLGGTVPAPTTSRTSRTRSPPRTPCTTWVSRPARRCARSRSTRSSSAPAPTAASRTCALAAEHHRGPQGRRGHPDARRPRLGPGAPAGRGRGPRRDLQGGRRRVARRRLLDVPGHEPRHARSRRAQRLDLQPQLRGPPGQGRSHPPGVRAGRRGHRRPRHALLARRPRARRPSNGAD